MRRAEVCVIGAGGHAKVVISTLQAAGYTPVAVYDDEPRTWGSQLLGVAVRGSTAELVTGAAALPAVIAIGDNRTRRAVAERLDHLDWISVIHPKAYVHESVRIGRGTVVFAGSVVQPDTTLGDHCIVNTGATVDHDSRVGNYVHFCPGTHGAGGVVVGEGVLLGIGSSVLPGKAIGAWTVVGAGATVVADLPAGVTATGVPASPWPRAR